jgi:hypothetical protein
VINAPGACATSTSDGFVHIVAGMAGNDYQVSWANTKFAAPIPVLPVSFSRSFITRPNSSSAAMSLKFSRG